MKKGVAWLLFGILIVSFVSVESKGLRNTLLGDDFVYFEMAKLMAEGKVPYRDFFNSHPILHAGVIYLFYLAFGYNMVLLTSIATVSEIAVALFLFLLVSERFGSKAAVVSVLLYLSTYLVPVMGVSVYGVNLALMWTMIGLYCLHKERPALAGMLYGLAGLTMLYSLPITFAVGTYLLVKKRTDSLRFFLGFLAVFGTANLALAFIPGYLEQVFFYHMKKLPVEGVSIEFLLTTIRQNGVLFASPFLWLLFLTRQKLRENSLFLWIIVVYMGFIFSLPIFFDYYLMMIFPYLALLGGAGTVEFAEQLGKRIRLKHASFILLVVLLGLFVWYSKESYYILWKYDFLDIRIEPFVDYINTHSDSQAPIFGDVLFASTLSLETGRPIYHNWADTNAFIFSSGIQDIGKLVAEMKEDPPSFVVARPEMELGAIPEFADFLLEQCRIGLVVDDQFYGEIFLFECDDENTYKEGAIH